MKPIANDSISFAAFNSAGLPIPPALPDSLLTDSVAEPVYGLIIENPIVREDPPVADKEEIGVSFVWLLLLGLFCAVALKFKNNARYLKAIISDLTDVRTRQNAFDETVKETSFLILLNVLWVCSIGILLWQTIMLTVGHPPIGYSFSIPDRPGLGIALCIGTTSIYTILMALAYWVIGFVFTDSSRAALWLKGAGASQGLETVLLLPLAALSLSYGDWMLQLLEIAAGVVILGKIIFIYKGFRIFFNQFSSWMLFLYYLCSVEIVPLILTYLATLQLCSVLL
ncbi:MAG: DUF4271 domain-containing protein [Bacteroides sp.]|nr:DUF4271 domain-containing protein [Bacteroides sp.]MDE7441612.1 DUF4271 domain-containing protein [Muribaculaceae bacterium]